MHARTLDEIDVDLRVETVELGYARRSGGEKLTAAWARIDALLEERSTVRHLVSELRHPSPRPLDGPLVQG